MNMQASWDDAQIHAYVDGELDAPTAARLEADSREDASLAERIARQHKLLKLLHAGFDSVLDEPVPQRLRDAVATEPKAPVISLESARQARAPAKRSAWSAREGVGIAATLVVGVLLGALAFRTPGGLPLESVQGQLVAQGELDTALSTQPGGSTTDNSSARIGLSFRAADGTWCRTFHLRGGATGLACRRQGHWAVQLLDHSEPGTVEAADGFRQAGSPLSPGMLGAIGALGADDALTREQEQQQLRAGWETAPP